MVVGRAARQALRRPVIEEIFPPGLVEAALQVLELTEYAWHDCYHEVSPSDKVIDEILVCSEGRLDTLVRAAVQAVHDKRDLQLWAESIRGAGPDT